MKTNHTPGPWNHTPLQETIWDSTGDVIIAKISDLPWINGKSDWMTEQANAYLIAASPALLGVCQQIVLEHENGNWPNGMEDILEGAQKAVAQAEGGKS